MKVWVVMGEMKYESDWIEHLCANKDLAEFLRDWSEAIQLDKKFHIDKCGYGWSSCVDIFYEVEEQEVLL